jgi:predicted small secreted protein
MELRMSRTRLISPVLLILLALTIGSCRTFEGLGEDLSTLGGKISNKARDKAQD